MNYNYVVSIVTIVHKYLYSHIMYVHIIICDMYVHSMVAHVNKWMIELFGTIAENQVISN